MSKIDTPPNGVLIYLDDQGRWVISANRFSHKVLDQELYDEMFNQARQFLAEARESGVEDLVDPDDDEGIAERLPKIGDEVPGLENINRVTESLEEAASIVPKLWGWIVGIEDSIPAELEGLSEPE